MAYLGKTPSQAVRSRYYYTASGGETSLSGSDDNSNVLTFTDGNYVDVSLNGATLVAGSDYNTTTTNTIGGLAALTASDIVEVLVYDTFSVFGGNVTGDFTVGGTLTAANITNTGNLNFGDNDKAIFGAGSDLQIYHDGSNSFIDDAGTGNVFLRGSSQVIIGNMTGEQAAVFNDNGAVTINYDNAQKLATTATGVDVTGAISSNKGSAGTLATFTDGVNSNFVVETASLLTTIGNGGGSTALAFKSSNTERMRIDSSGSVGISKSAYGSISTDGFWWENGVAKYLALSGTGTSPLYLNRNGSDGGIVNFYKDGSNVGRIGAKGGDLTLGTGAIGVRFEDSSNSIVPFDISSAGSTDNDVDLGKSSVRFKDLYLGGGVYLGGTGSANKLDEYEEGTWTPVDASGAGLSFGTPAGAVYTKIGRLVLANFSISYPSTSSTARAAIGGLPFTALNLNLANFGAIVGYTNETTAFSVHVNPNNTTADLYEKDGTNLTNATLSGNALRMCIIYFENA